MTNPNTKYKVWIQENKEKVIEYVLQHDISLSNINMSPRAYNVLRLAGYNMLSEIILLSFEELSSIESISKDLAKEIYVECRHYLLEHKNPIIDFVNNSRQSIVEISELQKLLDANNTNDSASDVNREDDNNSEKVEEELPVIDDTPIEVLKLSTRAFNSLKRFGIHTIQDLIEKVPDIKTNPDSLLKIKNIGRGSANEVYTALQNYAPDGLFDEVSNETDDITEDVDVSVRETPIDVLNLSTRAFNALKKANINTINDLLERFPDCVSDYESLCSIKNMGTGSAKELSSVVYNFIVNAKTTTKYNGNSYSIYTEEYIKNQIISNIEGTGFKGWSFSEIKSVFPDDLDDDLIKKCIGSLLAEKELEYVDYRCYRVYPSFYDFLTSDNTGLDSKKLAIVKSRLSGYTLEEVGTEFNVTRERIRQIVQSTIRKLRKTQKRLFDEDYYQYLFTNYEVNKGLWLKYINVSEQTLNYLITFYKTGKQSIDNALSDENIDYNIKLRIRDYENRNKLLLDGVLVDNTHTAIEEFVLSRYTHDEMQYDDFMELCNSLLKDNRIPYDEKYYFTPELIRTRKNRLAGSMNCLWKHGERLRYYDIENSDFTELYETLNLEGYKNTEVSTLKFIEDFPELMEKYDIRDQYELHNLLKKTIPNGSFNDIAFGRQPIITFGDFDRTAALFEILKVVAPVTIEDFIEYIHIEYGYERSTTASSYIQPLMKYYHNGMFSIDFKKVPEERIGDFKAALTEDFYLIKDIEKLYSTMYPSADIEEINPYSLKDIGFIVYSKHVVRNTYKNSEEYFIKTLTENDVFSIKPFSERFATIGQYYSVYMELRKNYDIMLFENDQLISIRRLEKLNISKNDIIDYCKAVIDYVDESEFFTIYSLHESGFNSKLDELGFDDSFYAGILSMYPAFSYQRIFGTVVLKVDSNNELFSKKTFILSQLSKYDSVDTYEFIDDCYSEFGISIPNKYDITEAISGTDFYYDSIMDKFYKNKSYYYNELDD